MVGELLIDTRLNSIGAFAERNSVVNRKGFSVLLKFSCRCNMTYKIYMNTSMSMLEGRINMVIGKSPQLIKSLIIKDIHPITRQCEYLLLNK